MQQWESLNFCPLIFAQRRSDEFIPVRTPLPTTTDMARLRQNLPLASAINLGLAFSLALLHSPGSRAGASLSPPSPAFVKLPTPSPQFPNRTTSTRTTNLGAAAPPRPSHSDRRTTRLSTADSSDGRGDDHVGRGGGDAGPPVSAPEADISTASTSTVVPVVPVPNSVDISLDGSDGVVEKSPNLGAYWGILRPHNIPASFGLVAAGALVASHSPSSLMDVKVRWARIVNLPNPLLLVYVQKAIPGINDYLRRF